MNYIAHKGDDKEINSFLALPNNSFGQAVFLIAGINPHPPASRRGN
jgi:hypothetical protein